MDIEPLWALGGWFLFSNCMATPKSHTPITETCSKYSPHHFLFFFALLLILLLVTSQPTGPLNPSAKLSSTTVKRILIESTDSDSATSTTTTAMNLHPEQTHKAHRFSSSSKSKHREFGVEAHEVPSGPNPISN
ncbi:hypothetical protein K2173_025643 [Erythroxylum novogranatense]|uniref:CLAVATA3/ESR (CLE)-related protein 44 n=1 Tax=Erythroxylum novogranatense TaxID=1862640 RepID=A0AAV8SBN0_9ROSI|nr:hypothetical protein K2173_025643 [Erythroxylum novogranatense]